MTCKKCNSENIIFSQYNATKAWVTFCYDCQERMPLLENDVLELFREMQAETAGQEQQAQKDPVNNPAHYTDGKIEVIDFIEDKQLGFHLGNAIKYICRAGKKDPEKTSEDLEKAIWYIRRHIKSLWED